MSLWPGVSGMLVDIGRMLTMHEHVLLPTHSDGVCAQP